MPDGFEKADLDWVTRASSAWGSRHGITLVEAQSDVREATPETPDMRSLGAWMRHSGFVFSHALSVDDGWETEWRYGLAGGDLSGTRPDPLRGFESRLAGHDDRQFGRRLFAAAGRREPHL